MDRLYSVSDIEDMLKRPHIWSLDCSMSYNLADQLLDTMRENIALKQMLDSHALASRPPGYSDLQRENERLRKTLEWYADEKNWVTMSMPLGNGQNIQVPGFGHPSAYQAQKALGQSSRPIGTGPAYGLPPLGGIAAGLPPLDDYCLSGQCQCHNHSAQNLVSEQHAGCPICGKPTKWIMSHLGSRAPVQCCIPDQSPKTNKDKK